MKVYVVKCMDTNCVTSIDKIFLHKQDAEQYISVQKDDSLVYFVSEYHVLADSNQCCGLAV